MILPFENALAVLDKPLVQLHIAASSESRFISRTLSAPETDGRVRPQSSEGWVEEVLYGAATTGDDIVALVSAYRADEGAVVLEFGPDGTLRARYRCKLPASVDLKSWGNPGGHMLASKLAVARNVLCLASFRDKMCAAYELPSHAQ
jgi:hypothetical protein